MKTVYFFLLGAWEFRSDFTSNPGPWIEAYDTGRELAHRVTFRHFDS